MKTVSVWTEKKVWKFAVVMLLFGVAIGWLLAGLLLLFPDNERLKL